MNPVGQAQRISRLNTKQTPLFKQIFDGHTTTGGVIIIVVVVVVDETVVGTWVASGVWQNEPLTKTIPNCL